VFEIWNFSEAWGLVLGVSRGGGLVLLWSLVFGIWSFFPGNRRPCRDPNPAYSKS
jgi:hypothetical protein